MAAIGTSIWIAVEARPISTDAARNTGVEVAVAATARAATSTASVATISRRLASRSTSGTSSTSPAA